MDPRFYTRHARANLRQRLHDLKVGPCYAFLRHFKCYKWSYFWWSYFVIGFLMFGYQMNHYVSSGPDGQPYFFLTVLGSLIAGVVWPMVAVTWLFA